MATIRIRKGNGAPGATALSVSEPAFDYTNNALYIGITGGGNKWIGAEVDNSTALGTSQIKIPTQYAVKTYVDNNVAAGAVSSLNGLTGGITLGVSTGLSIASAGKGITLTNTGVQQATAGSGISVSGATGNVTITNAGVTGLVGSTYLSVSSATGNITLTNTGVQTLSIGAGSGIQAGTVSGTTGIISYTITNTGVTGLQAGTAISVNSTTGNITVTNQGVQQATAGSGISVSGATGNVTFTNTGVTGLQAGTGIFVNTSTGNITVTNQGVRTFNGLTGDVSGVTTTVANTFTAAQTFNAGITTTTLAATSNASVGGNLTITGNLTVNGTTSYVNSTVTEIYDPIITIGGATGGAMPTTDDNKDRGIAFKYHTGSAGRTGFFGYQDSTGYFTFIPNATLGSEVVTAGAAGTARFNGVITDSGSALTLTSQNTSNAVVTIQGDPVSTDSYISAKSGYFQVGNAANQSGLIKLYGTSGTYLSTIASGALSADNTFTLPTHASGTIVAPTNLGTSGYILKANGTTSQPTWIDANAAGFTAFAATNVNLTSDTTDTTCFITFTATGATGGQALRFNSSLTYNAVTNFLEANIDGGSY